MKNLFAISLTISSDWNTLAITSINLTGEAGSDITSWYESGPPDFYIDINDIIPSSTTWTVYIHQITGVNWNNNYILQIERTSDGTGTGSISGGTNYLTINATAQVFFTVINNRNNINCRLKLKGVSLANSNIKNYSTTLVYTISDY